MKINIIIQLISFLFCSGLSAQPTAFTKKINLYHSIETEYELAEENGYTSGTAKSTYDMLQRYNNPLKAFEHIRKYGEKGAIHFAKDYPELSTITIPAIKNVSISFSSTPFKGNGGTVTTVFKSTDHIYARLTVSGGTLKEVLQLNENNYKLFVDYHIYPAAGEQFKLWSGLVQLYVKASQFQQSFLDFDIKPSPDAIIVYNDPADSYAFYISAFPSLHTPEFFPSSGAYKVGIKIGVPEKDEWGNSTGKVKEAMGFFDYQFAIKNATTILEEGQVVRKAIQSGIRFSPKSLPKEWKMPTAAPAVNGFTIVKLNNLYSQFYKDVTIIKTYLSAVAGTTWKVILSNDQLMPAYKYFTQTIFFFVKDAVGNCYYHPCDLRQDYTGDGHYGPIHLAVFDEEKVYVNCNEMK